MIRGTQSIATTQIQARYMMPQAVQNFRALSGAVAESVVSGKADIGTATKGTSQFDDLVSFPCCRWHRMVAAPDGRRLLAPPELTLTQLATYLLIS